MKTMASARTRTKRWKQQIEVRTVAHVSVSEHGVAESMQICDCRFLPDPFGNRRRAYVNKSSLPML